MSRFSTRTSWRFLATILLPIVAAGSARVFAQSEPVTITIPFERACLDLDSGAQAVCNPRETSGWDIVLGWNSQRVVHAVLFHNAKQGARLAFLPGATFEAVTASDITAATFQESRLDIPMDGSGVYLIRTDTEAVYKVGLPDESAGVMTLTYALLEGGVQ